MPHLGQRKSSPLAAVKKSDKIIWGASAAPNGFKNFRRAMRIPNMYLVLKLDIGKVVSITDEQTQRAIQYRNSI